MHSTNAKLRQVKEFARGAGVTVRTLHLYDRLGLLKPAALSGSGYRLYGEAELERLEQILALRFVGFSLDQIKELLRGPRPPVVTALRMQRNTIEHQKRRLEAALTAIDEAERRLSGDPPAELWETLRNVMEVFKVQNDWEWTLQYYSGDARERVEERARTTPRDVIERGERDWTALLADVEAAAARNLDPSSDEAQRLAARWRDLIAQFTGGDAATARGLNRLWSDQTHWPGGFKRPWSDAAESFIRAAMR